LEPYKLERDVSVTFRHDHERPTYFFFDIESVEKAIIDSTEETYTTRNIEVLISNDLSKEARPENYQWKSEYGPNTVEIDPNTDKFSKGRFKVCFRTVPDPKAAQSEPVEITTTLRFAKVPIAIKLNNREEPLSITLDSRSVQSQSAFFRYVLPENKDYDNHWVLLQLSRKSKLAAYIHWKVLPTPSRG